MTLDDEVRSAYAKGRRQLLPSPLIREFDFFRRVQSLVGLIYCAPWLYFGFKSVAVMNWLHDVWLGAFLSENWASLWRLGLAAIFFFYHMHASKEATGLYYPMHLWELSLERREQEWRAQNPDKADALNKLGNPTHHMLHGRRTARGL